MKDTVLICLDIAAIVAVIVVVESLFRRMETQTIVIEAQQRMIDNLLKAPVKKPKPVKE